MRSLKAPEARQYYRTVSLYGAVSCITGFSISFAVVSALGHYIVPLHSFLTPSIKYLMILYSSFLLTIAGTTYGAHVFDHCQSTERNHTDNVEGPSDFPKKQNLCQFLKNTLYEHRYWTCGIFWLATMFISLALMRHDPLMSSSQKLAQARVIAQESTINALLITSVMEFFEMMKGHGKYEKIIIIHPGERHHEDSGNDG